MLFRSRQSREIEAVRDVERKSGAELFAEFYELQNNVPMSGVQAEYIRQLMEQVGDFKNGGIG